MAAGSEPAAKRKRGPGRPFVKGQSGNPAGGRKLTQEELDVRAMARTYTERAISRLAEIMESENERAAAAASTAMLDRGWGSPNQTVDVNLGMQQFDQAVRNAATIIRR